MTTNPINPRVENYAIFLKNTCSETELHAMFSNIYADKEVMSDWELSEDEFFGAIELAYFQPATNFPRIH